MSTVQHQPNVSVNTTHVTAMLKQPTEGISKHFRMSTSIIFHFM